MSKDDVNESPTDEKLVLEILDASPELDWVLSLTRGARVNLKISSPGFPEHYSIACVNVMGIELQEWKKPEWRSMENRKWLIKGVFRTPGWGGTSFTTSVFDQATQSWRYCTLSDDFTGHIDPATMKGEIVTGNYVFID